MVTVHTFCTCKNIHNYLFLSDNDIMEVINTILNQINHNFGGRNWFVTFNAAKQ